MTYTAKACRSGTLSLVLALCLAAALNASGPVVARSDFESGSPGLWRVESDTHVLFTPRRDWDQDSVNTAVTWFYGCLSNVLDREVTLEAAGLDYTVYNGVRGTFLPFARNTYPVFSYDRENWQRFTCCTADSLARTFRMRQVFSRDTVWVAYTIPYTLSRLEALLQQVKACPAVRVEAPGRSVEGRPLYLVTVAEPSPAPGDSRPVVWVAARQHAFESGGSWAAEGLLRFLASDSPEAVELRRRLVFRVWPMLNPDGVENGGTRFNARGVDLNRHWHQSDPLSDDPARAPEITLVKKALAAWRASHRLDLWINIHNNDMVWNDDGDYIRFAPAEQESRARRLEAILRRETTFSGSFTQAPDSTATEAVVAAQTGALALVMEMKTGYLDNLDRFTGKDIWLDHGRGLARAAAGLLLDNLGR